MACRYFHCNDLCIAVFLATYQEDVLQLHRKSCCVSPCTFSQWSEESRLELQLLLSYKDSKKKDSSQQLGDNEYFLKPFQLGYPLHLQRVSEAHTYRPAGTEVDSALCHNSLDCAFLIMALKCLDCSTSMGKPSHSMLLKAILVPSPQQAVQCRKSFIAIPRHVQ